MKSIILIGDRNFNMDQIRKINHAGSISTNHLNELDRFVVEFNDGNLYYDYAPEIINDYEQSELKMFPFDNLNFVSLCYSSIDVLKRVLTQINYLRGIWIDNDYGLILPIEEFVHILGQNPKWDWIECALPENIT